MKPIKTILDPDCGEVIYESHRLAIIYCATHRVDVEYKHNAKTFSIKYGNLESVIDSKEVI